MEVCSTNLNNKHCCADQLSSYSSSLGATQSGANHIAMSIFGWFAVFGDVVSQAAQAFLPATVCIFPRSSDNVEIIHLVE